MTTPKNISGDLTIPTRSVGVRPQVILTLGDSIPTGWLPRFYGELPGVVGMDDALIALLNGAGSGRSVQPPADPGTSVAHYDNYSPRYFAGAGVLASAATAGATSLSLNYLSGGYVQTGMKLTVGTNTVQIGAAYAMAQPPSNPVTVPLASPIGAVTNGAAVSWLRPSGATAGYCFNQNCEIVFAAGANPNPGAFYITRLCNLQTPTNGGVGADESTFFHDGLTFANGPLTATLVYLAGPNSLNANCLTLWGSPAGVGFPAAGIVSVNFNPYAATPTIRTVSLNIPAPVGFSTANSGATVTVTPSGIGTYAGGEVFAPMMIILQKTGAAGGYIVLCGANGGFTLGDYAGSNVPPVMSAAFVAQYVTALAASPVGGLDTLMMQLGINNWISQASGVADMRTIFANVRAGNAAAKCIANSYYALSGTSAAMAQISAAVRQFSADAGVVAFDWFNDCGDYNFVNTLLSDGVHPSSPLGQKMFARTEADFFARCAVAQTQTIHADLISIDGVPTAGGSAVLSLQKFAVVNPNGDAVTFQSTGNNGNGLAVLGTGTGSGIYLYGSGGGGPYVFNGTNSVPSGPSAPGGFGWGAGMDVSNGGILADITGRLSGAVGQGDGAIAVNHDTGGADNLRFEFGFGSSIAGVDGADVRAYLLQDYVAGNVGAEFIKGQTTTAPVGSISGRIANPMFLDAGNSYIVTFNKQGFLATCTNRVDL